MPLSTGNLYGNVADEQGGALPGVTVTLKGKAAPRVQVTDAQGDFRFMDLPPGTYHVEAELEGFAAVAYLNIQISMGRNTTVYLTMSPAVE